MVVGPRSVELLDRLPKFMSASETIYPIECGNSTSGIHASGDEDSNNSNDCGGKPKGNGDYYVSGDCVVGVSMGQVTIIA
jgi:hypothetical protein